MKKLPFYVLLLLSLVSFNSKAADTDQTQLAVWANEAIIATYSYDYQNFLKRQQEIAKYFSAKGWIDYSKALQSAKLAEAVQSNSYTVTAVATLPPTLKDQGAGQWQAVMPILVLYKNPQYQQTQNLKVSLTFSKAQAGQGVRGLTILSLSSEVANPPCRCQK